MQVPLRHVNLLVQYAADARTAVQQTLYRQCGGETVCREDIEDLGSDAIRDAFIWLRERDPDSSVDDSHLRNSVRLIAKRRALNWYYRRHRRDEIFDEFRGIIRDHLHQRQESHETLKRLDDVFAFADDVLDADEIQLIRMKYMEGKGHKAIAAALGITPANSRAKLSRAIKKLHARLTEPLEEPARFAVDGLAEGLDEPDVPQTRASEALLTEENPGEHPRDATVDDAKAIRRSLSVMSSGRRRKNADPGSNLERISPPPVAATDENVLEGLFELYGELKRVSG